MQNSYKFNPKKEIRNLEVICRAPISKFFEVFKESAKNELGYIYVTNPNAKILVVAHLDFYDLDYSFEVLEHDGDMLIFSPRLDDRLGVYTILSVLPSIGIEVDFLLTTNEEFGMSTALEFSKNEDVKEKYNWIVGLDRGGMKTVSYQYETRELNEKLLSCDLDVGKGSYSDIVDMECLNTAAFNLALGYRFEHKPSCYVRVSQYENQINRFAEFFERFEDERISHEGGYYDDDEFIFYTGEKDPQEYPFTLECEKCGEIFYEEEIGQKTCELCNGEQYRKCVACHCETNPEQTANGLCFFCV